MVAIYRSNWSLHGDFDVAMDYSLTTWPVGNGVRIGIQVADWYNSERVSQVWLGSLPGEEAYVFAAGGINGVISTSDLNGTLRLSRAGSVLSGYFWDAVNSKWVVIGTGSVPLDDYPLTIAAWTHDAFFNHQEVDVNMSNLRVDDSSLTLDSDGDGIIDRLDECPNSIVTATILVHGCDSGVPNPLDANGCTLADKLQLDEAIAAAASGARNHGTFASNMAHYLNAKVAAGVITLTEQKAIMSCVGALRLP
jgi:hypothetical protein